jgi:hypothetical protein
MMKLIEKLAAVWKDSYQPFLVHRGRELKFADILDHSPADLLAIRPGDVVALIGDLLC